MTALSDLLKYGRPMGTQQPWPRFTVDERAWGLAAAQLAAGRMSLLGLWAEPEQVHAALFDDALGEIAVISIEVIAGRFPSIGRLHPPAIRLERMIQDLWGLAADGAVDTRPWLDHGAWNIRTPLGNRTPAAAPEPYAFLAAEGESLHQIPVGPIHAAIIEPGHFRFTCNGETIVRLEERLGYAHKGVEGLMAGAELGHAAKLAGRVSGDSTVAYALAFARAAEEALAIDVPPRAIWLRALMAELERLANHFGDIGAICNDAAFALMHAHCGVLRERVLRASETAFGHRLMRDRIIPGGVSADLSTGGIAILRALVIEARERFPRLVKLYDNTTSLQDRTVATGILRPELAARFGAGGYVGRASGRAFDARRKPGYAPYGELNFAVPARSEGDVSARVWIQIDEVEQSLRLIEQILERLPAGPIAGGLPGAVRHTPCEGLALVEGFRGDILVWLRLDRTGRVLRCHLRDPSWFQWPLLEAVIEGNIVADFPICNKSFNCSYSGHDL
jgi:Ni,Fe-hydrogenase III large subunit